MEKITRAEKFQAIRWANLLVGLLQLHYYVAGASLFTGIIAYLNIGVWALTRKIRIK